MEKSNLLQFGSSAVGVPFNTGPGNCDCGEPGPGNCGYLQTIIPICAAHYALQDEVAL